LSLREEGEPKGVSVETSVGWLIRNWSRPWVHNHGSKKQQTHFPYVNHHSQNFEKIK
jgi:hypothetical protein